MVSLLEVIGPVMIGPSSSHTAGAARLGLAAARIFGSPVRKVDFFLNGSFAETFHGHGTDRALLAGVMGFGPDDERLVRAFDEAKLRGIQYQFIKVDLADVHPNSVRMVLSDDSGSTCDVRGASVGGGSIVIDEIEGFALEITCEYPVLITFHRDCPGVVAAVTGLLAQNNVNIAFLKVFRQNRGSRAVMVAETDQTINEQIINEIGFIDGVYRTRFLERI